MFLAIDRTSKFTYVEFRDDAGKMNGAEFASIFDRVCNENGIEHKLTKPGSTLEQHAIRWNHLIA